MLSDPARLPYRTDITIGDLKMAMSISGIFDENGDYVGNVMEWEDVTETRLNAGILAALRQNQMVVEYDLSGVVTDGNDRFFELMGGSRAEICGRPHATFVFEAERKGQEYATLWSRLAAGEFVSGKVRRRTLSGEELWLDGTLNPIKDASGQVFRIVELANDITEIEQKAFEQMATLDAIGHSQAVIEFTPKGEILRANQNLLDAMGYGESEIVGKHHRMFMPADLRDGAEYARFWERLAAGEAMIEIFRRMTKDRNLPSRLENLWLGTIQKQGRRDCPTHERR